MGCSYESLNAHKTNLIKSRAYVLHKMRRTVVSGEKVSDTTYKLVAEGNYTYRYTLPDIESLPDDYERAAEWREAQQILLDWIQNPIGKSPVYIGWNRCGKALLMVELKSIFNPIPEWNNFVSEINPFEYPDDNRWFVDETRPTPDNVPKPTTLEGTHPPSHPSSDVLRNALDSLSARETGHA